MLGLPFPSLIDADGAIVSAAFTASSESNLFQITVPGDGSSIVMGQLTLTLAEAGLTDMTYMLDAVGDSPVLTFGFGPAENPIIYWFRRPDDITGGTLAMEVIPEPATLALLALGGIAVPRRSRAHRRTSVRAG